MLTIAYIGGSAVQIHWGFMVILTIWVVMLAPPAARHMHVYGAKQQSKE